MVYCEHIAFGAVSGFNFDVKIKEIITIASFWASNQKLVLMLWNQSTVFHNALIEGTIAVLVVCGT